jgi:hypothetical protein
MLVTCPHCREYVIISELNCAVFRHGYDKNFEQIPPHATQKECALLTVYGCGKPFEIVNGVAVKCDYV